MGRTKLSDVQMKLRNPGDTLSIKGCGDLYREKLNS